MKRCACCHETKPLEEFTRAASSADGRQSWCKACKAADAKCRYHADPEPARLEPLLDVREVARILGISRDGVYKLIGEGELRPARVGERWRFLPDDVRAYLDRHREAVPT